MNTTTIPKPVNSESISDPFTIKSDVIFDLGGLGGIQHSDENRNEY
jgi:hypothetical protein